MAYNGDVVVFNEVAVVGDGLGRICIESAFQA